jgi:hypothetical protein
MNASRKLKIVLLTAVVTVFGLDAGERLSIPGVGSVFTTAQAIVGRPLTPSASRAWLAAVSGAVRHVSIAS